MWTVFAIFLSLLMIPKMRMVIELTKLNWKYSIKRIFIVLEKLHKIKDENGDLKAYDLRVDIKDGHSEITGLIGRNRLSLNINNKGLLIDGGAQDKSTVR